MYYDMHIAYTTSFELLATNLKIILNANIAYHIV